MSKAGRTTTRSGRHPIRQLRQKIEKAFGADRSKNPIVIKHHPGKQGYGVFARRNLRKGALVAYYAIKLFRVSKSNKPTPTNDMYVTCAPSSPKNPKGWSRTFYGDIGKHAGDVFGRYVFRGKPVCGHVINEPGKGERENCDMPTTVWDASLLKDGRKRPHFKAGDVVFHDIKTLRPVKKGEELVTVYNDDYQRNYELGKKFKQK